MIGNRVVQSTGGEVDMSQFDRQCEVAFEGFEFECDLRDSPKSFALADVK